MEEFKVQELEASLNVATIKVIGVGGGGTNMVNHMARETVLPIEMLAANTDAQHLNSSLASVKIQIGAKITKGLGAGMQPDIGKDSAIESEDEIRSCLNGSDIIFVAAGLGGGTGTGAAPEIARIAKSTGALTISVVTKPFRFEGKKRRKLAEIGLEAIKLQSDSLIVIPNEKLSSVIDRSTGFENAFKIVDSILYSAVNGISGVILNNSVAGINTDFADLKTIMSFKGVALMGIGDSSGECAPTEAIKSAIESPLLEDVTLEGAKGVLINYQMHPNYPFLEIEESMEFVEDMVHEDADIVFGVTSDVNMPEDSIKITIIATGFDGMSSEHKSIQNKKPEQAQLFDAYSNSTTINDINENDLDQPSIFRKNRPTSLE
jgi:cell division protein FtsZ